MDQSKTHVWANEQLRQVLSRYFPQALINVLFSFSGRFCVTFVLAAGIMAGLFDLQSLMYLSLVFAFIDVAVTA